MQWRGRRESDNVEDRRGMSGGTIATGGGILGLVGFILYLLLGGNPSDVPQNPLTPGGQIHQMTAEEQAADDQRAEFVKVVLADTEDIWAELMKQMGKTYIQPKLVLFRDGTQSGCGMASSASGPFYCPADEKVYIDLSFYQELQDRFQAPGEFAEAYVIAHEVGHHIQNLLGVSDKMDRKRQELSEEEYNKLSVKLELQADFYAGVWAHYEEKLKNVIDPNDIEDALNAANAIGDDRLQKETQGYVVPESFTHGTSAQRVYWFKKGYETGDVSQGNTFQRGDLD